MSIGATLQGFGGDDEFVGRNPREAASSPTGSRNATCSAT